MKQPLSKQVSVSELRHMREVDGLTNKEIAQRLDVSASTIGKYLGPPEPGWQARAGKKGGRGRLSQETIDEIRRLYKEGHSINGIQEKVHVSWETVKRYTKDLGPNRKKKHVQEPVFQEPVYQSPTFEGTPLVKAVTTVAQPVTTVRKPVCEVISSRRTVKLKGLECQYEVETDGTTGTLTVVNGTSEVAIFDTSTLDAFIEELTMIRKEYLSA